ncbi:response regulator transcription factor [Paenarthrobacter nitroguajacolicus]|uniref:response regulator transcription factor n=1 Tax=Paenarthrobacter nitroguajacolicus TaxID=211146 RepID=UPI001C4BB232|nr:response regulator transcription factor [Paenarthrobacter nitroguajacolicus]
MNGPDGHGKLRVVLIDDEELVRAGLALLLAAETDIEIVGEANNGRSGLEIVAKVQPDVVVMDIRMPVMDGVEATKELMSNDSAGLGKIPVLILSTFSDDDAVHAALRAGASGFLLKNSAPTILAAAIRALANGAGWLDPNVTKGLLDQFSSSSQVLAPTSTEFGGLTRREIEVLTAMANGMTNTQIAAALFLSEATVKTHVHRILMKLGVADRSQAVSAAFRHGLVRPGSK